MRTLVDILDEMTVEGKLYESLPGGAVRCFACGHRCLIREGKRGICQVRFNREGKLFVPRGYVAALQADPIEKKPFFHVFPGTDALTFGMLGCDFHCGYCFPGDTMIVSDKGPLSLADAFSRCEHFDERSDVVIGYPGDLRAVTASGKFHKVRAVFKHPYRGKLTVIKPYYLPELRCTPDHRVYATLDPTIKPELIPAEQLTDRHYLVLPRKYPFFSEKVLDAANDLNKHGLTFPVPWDSPEAKKEIIAEATYRGETSPQMGLALGVSSSSIRQVRSKIAVGAAITERTSGLHVEAGTIGFPNKHPAGLPLSSPLDEKMARLLGYYCAEGSIVQSKHRPNSHSLNFSFSPGEIHKADEVRCLLQECLGLQSHLVHSDTTLTVSLTKASAALYFRCVAGEGAAEKYVPQALFDAPKHVVGSFLAAFVSVDEQRHANCKINIATVSRKLAYGLAWLVLKQGYLPSIYDKPIDRLGQIKGRLINQSPKQYSVVWYEGNKSLRKAIETQDHFLIPVRKISSIDYAGDVYNMEVDEEHNYLAGFLLVSNCQNWVTSQAARDEASDISIEYVRKTDPEQLVTLAKRAGASVVASSYNEPLITAEWATEVFAPAIKAGLKCVFISNGNATREALEYLRPYLVAYKIDLKTMQDKRYRQLGGVLQHVLDTIRLAHEIGLWVEVVTLVVPGFNDSTEELMDAARYIHSVSPDIPWHVTGFHPDYKMTDPSPTSRTTLLRAAEIGQEAGLNFVYAGNLPGRVNEYENTYCAKCHHLLIERSGYSLLNYKITAQGTCPQCGTGVPGIWTSSPQDVRLEGPGMPRRIA